jgi:hypothetical protein
MLWLLFLTPFVPIREVHRLDESERRKKNPFLEQRSRLLITTFERGTPFFRNLLVVNTCVWFETRFKSAFANTEEDSQDSHA